MRGQICEVHSTQERPVATVITSRERLLTQSSQRTQRNTAGAHNAMFVVWGLPTVVAPPLSRFVRQGGHANRPQQGLLGCGRILKPVIRIPAPQPQSPRNDPLPALPKEPSADRPHGSSGNAARVYCCRSPRESAEQERACAPRHLRAIPDSYPIHTSTAPAEMRFQRSDGRSCARSTDRDETAVPSGRRQSRENWQTTIRLRQRKTASRLRAIAAIRPLPSTQPIRKRIADEPVPTNR